MESKTQVTGGGWKPSPEQELLLRAALWQNDAAREAWLKWYATTRIEGLEHGSYRLLPLLYLNLASLQIQHPGMTRLEIIYRHARSRNLLKLRRAAGALKAIQSVGIPTMVLKACAMIPLYYRDPAARPMADIDILVPTEQAPQAIRTLESAGWEPVKSLSEQMSREYFLRMHAHTLRTRDTIELDLHRHVFSFETRADGDDELWAGAIPVTLDGVETTALNPADQLLHICAHGAEWNPTPPVRWVADAYVLLRESEIDWQRLLLHASLYESVLIAQHALQYLREAMQAPIPAHVIDALGQLPVSRQERIRYEFLVTPHSEHNAAVKVWYHYGQFRRLDQVYKHEKWFLRFPAFLRDTWGLPNLRAVPKYMTRFAANWIARRLAPPHQEFQGKE